MRRRVYVEIVDDYFDSKYWKLYDKLGRINMQIRDLLYTRAENSKLISRLNTEIIYLEEKGKNTSCARHKILDLKIDNLALSVEIYALSNERDVISEQLEEFQNGARW